MYREPICAFVLCYVQAKRVSHYGHCGGECSGVSLQPRLRLGLQSLLLPVDQTMRVSINPTLAGGLANNESLFPSVMCASQLMFAWMRLRCLLGCMRDAVQALLVGG